MNDVFPLHECIILDARCIVNLYASGCMKTILKDLQKHIAVAAYVCEGDAMSINSGSAENVMGKSEVIDLQPIIDENLLQVVYPNEREENTVINLSAASYAPDSGEAITAAIAIHRGWSLGTDDKAAIFFLRQKAPALSVISTLDMLKQWVDTTCPRFMTIRILLNNIRHQARYQPYRQHHLYEWWEQYMIGMD